MSTQDQQDQGSDKFSMQGALPYIIIALAVVIIIMQAIALFAPRGGRPVASNVEPAQPRPTRTFTLAPTSVPATDTPAPTSTPKPPTPVPPTATLIPPTPVPPTPEPPTPVPPTPEPPTPIPPTRKPPTPVPPTPIPPTPVPLTLLSELPLNNGEWGTNTIMVQYRNEVSVKHSDGHFYKGEIGFLSSPEAAARVQEFWHWHNLGGANWRAELWVFPHAEWVNCTEEHNACAETNTDSGQARFDIRLYIKPYVWNSLLDSYLAGGIAATTGNQYYNEIQKEIFMYLGNCDATPNIPCVGFKFTRVS